MKRVLLLLILASVAGSDPCPNEGSVPQPARCDAGPPLGCPHAPLGPSWHLLTPPHRAPAPQPGKRPGDARVLPRLLVRYRCTGLRLLPLVPAELRALGFVLDVPAHACR